MVSHGKNIKVFSGNSHKELAYEIANLIGVPLGKGSAARFSDGEVSVSIEETVRGSDVFLIQSTSQPVNENLMELLVMIDALRRASAGSITAVMPYFGYARQDRKAKPRDPISAKLVADLISAAGANRVVTMDLHAAQIQGFFNVPLDHLASLPVIWKYYSKKIGKNKKDYVAVSPDLGSVPRVRKFAEKLDLPLAIVDKRRPRANVSEVMNIIGDVSGKKVIMCDDLIDTAGTLCNSAAALVEKGATEIYACATHGVLSGDAVDRIDKSVIKELTLLDTIDIPQEKRIGKIQILSVASIFAEAIERIYEDLSVSCLFV